MIVRSEEAEERVADENTKLKIYIKGQSKNISLALGEVRGFHGTFLNRKSERVYFILSGSGSISIEGRKFSVSQEDCVLVPVNSKHSIEGEMRYLVIDSPPFDPKDEIKC